MYRIDSKPTLVYRISRAKRCKLGKNDFKTAPNFGCCATQNTYYYGYKMHIVCGIRGVIHSYELLKASAYDLHYLNDIKYDFHYCTIIGDKGYLCASVQMDFFETANIQLEVPYRLNKGIGNQLFAFRQDKETCEKRFSHRWLTNL